MAFPGSDTVDCNDAFYCAPLAPTVSDNVQRFPARRLSAVLSEANVVSGTGNHIVMGSDVPAPLSLHLFQILEELNANPSFREVSRDLELSTHSLDEAT